MKLDVAQNCGNCLNSWGEGTILYCSRHNNKAIYLTDLCLSFSPIKDENYVRPMTEIGCIWDEGLKIEIPVAERFMLAESTQYFRGYVGPVDIVVDLGAHVGTFTLYAAKRGSTVYAVEASERNYLTLLKNINENIGILKGKVYPLHVAVTMFSGDTRQLRYSAAGNTGQKSLVFGPDVPVECEVKTISLSDLLTNIVRKHGRIDYLKCDIEGSEWEFVTMKDPKLPKLLSAIGRIDMSTHPMRYPSDYKSKSGVTGWNAMMADWLESMGVKKGNYTIT